MYLMAIDLGTSSVKVIVVSPDGRIVNRASAEYSIHRPKSGQAEQDPEEWWRAVVIAVREAQANVKVPSQDIVAIGLSGQMHGTVLLDANGELLAPAIIWLDQRAQDQVTEINAAIGLQRITELSGSPAAAGFQAATIRWFQQELPEIWRNVACVLTPKDYLRWRMIGKLQSEPSDGSGTLLFDIRTRKWSEELLRTVGINRDLLPSIGPSNGVAGKLLDRAASELGLPAGINVIYGAADTAAGILGAGLVDDATLLLTLSTGGQIVIPQRELRVDNDGRIHTFCSALEPGRDRPAWYMMAAMLSAGLSLRWLRDQIFQLRSEDAYQEMISWAKTAQAGANGLIFLPYLAGERTPHMDPNARGLLMGLTAGHTRADLVRAVMEGVVMAAYDAYLVLNQLGARPESIVMAGSGARSILWRQIVADVFDLPVRRLLIHDHSAMGAALLAGSGAELLDLDEQITGWARYGPFSQPEPVSTNLYRNLFAIFQGAYLRNKNDFHRLAKIDQ
jgi:xylulokinase